MSCSDIVSSACVQSPSCEVKEHKDWKAGRRKPPGIDGMEAVFDAFCTAGGGGGGGGWGWGGGGSGRAGAMSIATWNKFMQDLDAHMSDLGSISLSDRGARMSHGGSMSTSAPDMLFRKVCGRGLHTFTSLLNLSVVYGIGGARRDCVTRFKGV